MKKLLSVKGLFILLLNCLLANNTSSQCTTANINWDNLDYLVTSGTYNGYVTSAMAKTQGFTIGTNKLSIAVQNNITLNGENNIHSGETGSYGNGADVSYATTTPSARTITLTLNEEASNFKLSVYDLDRSQRITVTAKNASNAAKTVTLSKPSGGTVGLSGNPGNSPTGSGNSSNYSNNSNTGTLNIDIAGPVKTIVLSFSNASGDFWLSDIAACVTGIFPSNYYQVAKPFSGQPGYVLVAVNNSIYYTDPATGASHLLFTDPANNNINSVAYDLYKGYVYYTYSLTPDPETNKAIKKYDVNTGIISTIVGDITNLGIPVFDYGLESGGAAFYNGNLFIGIEGYDNDFEDDRKSIIWRLDFTGDVPTSATQ